MPIRTNRAMVVRTLTTPGARVVRGGYWLSSPSFLRAANRHFENPELTRGILGIRCARYK